MSSGNLDYSNPHYCPVYNREISIDLCYDSLCCLKRLFKISSVKELSEVSDIEKARQTCDKCEYSNLE